MYPLKDIIEALRARGYPDLAEDVLDVIHAMAFSKSDFENRLAARLNGALGEYFKYLISDAIGFKIYVEKWRKEATDLVKDASDFYVETSLKGKSEKEVKEKIVHALHVQFQKTQERKFKNVIKKMNQRYGALKEDLNILKGKETNLAQKGIAFLFTTFEKFNNEGELVDSANLEN